MKKAALILLISLLIVACTVIEINGDGNEVIVRDETEFSPASTLGIGGEKEDEKEE